MEIDNGHINDAPPMGLNKFGPSQEKYENPILT